VKSKAEDIQILLPSYNGQDYLAQQIESILAQSHEHWNLWIRDDASRDDTYVLAERFARRDGRIRLDRNPEQLGLRANLNGLLRAARQTEAQYFALSDQDDLWHPHKLTRQFTALRALETQLGAERPLLVHSDLQILDASNPTRRKSFWSALRIDPGKERSLGSLPALNVVSGNSLLCNRALLSLASPVPDEAIMHDWWFALVAASTGRILYLEEALVNYRRHASNLIGPKSFYAALWEGLSGDWLQPFQTTLVQSQRAYERLQSAPIPASPDWLDRLRSYGNLGAKTRFQRLLLLYRKQLLPPDPLRQLVLLGKALALPRALSP